MIEIGSRKRNLPPPARIVFESLTRPDLDSSRPWLELLDDEIWPTVIRADAWSTVVWSSLWVKRPDAVIRFDLSAAASGTDLRWTMYVDEPIPADALIGHLRKRVNQLINADLRYSFGS